VSPKVLHLSTYGAGGGAARAAAALHRAMEAEGVQSTLTTAQGGRFRLARELDRQLWRLQRSPVVTWRSPARFGSLTAETINRSDADIVNLHWVTNGFLSIESIGRITKPVVWSLYDMWTFCGTEHYGVDAPDARWRQGYLRSNRLAGETGIDIDRLAWQRKCKSWSPMHVVPASTWLTTATGQSALMHDWPITKIPHVIDTAAFAPQDMRDTRMRLGLPEAAPLILFLASAGIDDKRKGFDLLEAALPAVRESHPNVEVVVVGPITTGYESPTGVPIHWYGSVSGDEALRDLYTACNVTAAPSREDNMPLTAMEAQTCGRAVVAFDIGGLPDIVSHHETGYLAPEGNVESLAAGLTQAINDSLGMSAWGVAARERALVTWSPHHVVSQYLDLYESVLR